MARTEHFFGGAGQSVPMIARGAAAYAAQQGYRRPDRGYGSIVAHPAMTAQVAQAYQTLPSHQREALPAFRAMREETSRQFDYLTRPTKRGGLGVNVEVTDHDPYDRPADMFHDVAHNRTLKVWSSAQTGGHPVFSNLQNDQFRAVHDAFGHMATGRGVDRHGEEAAFVSHSGMYSPLARRAMATETRGQNSAMIAAGGRFQEQKIALLPSRLTSTIQPVVGQRSAARVAALHQARQFHAQQFGASGTML